MLCPFYHPILSCYVTSGYCQFNNTPIGGESASYADVLNNILGKNTVDTIIDCKAVLSNLVEKTNAELSENSEFNSPTGLKNVMLDLLNELKLDPANYNEVQLVEDLKRAIEPVCIDVYSGKTWHDICPIYIGYKNLTVDPNYTWF